MNKFVRSPKLIFLSSLVFLFSYSFIHPEPSSACEYDPNCSLSVPCPPGYTPSPPLLQVGIGICLPDCTCTFSSPVSKVDTGLGAIKTDPTEFVKDIASIFAKVVGGFSLLLLIYGSALYIISRGDPKATDKAQKIITSSVSGLLFVMFSILILKVIGIDILGLDKIVPGFGTGGPGGITLPNITEGL